MGLFPGSSAPSLARQSLTLPQPRVDAALRSQPDRVCGLHTQPAGSLIHGPLVLIISIPIPFQSVPLHSSFNLSLDCFKILHFPFHPSIPFHSDSIHFVIPSVPRSPPFEIIPFPSSIRDLGILLIPVGLIIPSILPESIWSDPFRLFLPSFRAPCSIPFILDLPRTGR